MSRTNFITKTYFVINLMVLILYYNYKILYTISQTSNLWTLKKELYYFVNGRSRYDSRMHGSLRHKGKVIIPTLVSYSINVYI